MENPNKYLLNKAFQKYGVYTFVELSKKTGIHYMTLRRMLNDDSHKIISPAFKLILELIPEQELKPFLTSLNHHLYPEVNSEV
jgi:hypothetical protein